MKIKHGLIVISLISALFGCAKEGEYLGGIITVTDAKKQQARVQEKETDYGIEEERFGEDVPWREGTITFTLSKDVDSVYPKIKQDFDFLTKDEVLRRPNGEWAVHSPSFNHVAQPGSFYDLRTRGKHRYQEQERGHNIGVVLEKNGNQTDVAVVFWLKDPDINLDSYAQSLQQRVENLF